MTKITTGQRGYVPATPTRAPGPLSNWLTGPQNQRVALAAGPAQARNAVPGPAAGQFQGYMQCDPGPRHADRMPDGDRAAVDVDDLGIHAEFAGGGERD